MNNNWLKQRSEIIAKYAESLPTKQDRISITFDYPDAGWMPVRFHKNGDYMGFLVFSYVYDCFVPLKEWLESIAEGSDTKASIVNLDCERFHGVLYYEPVWFYDYENYQGKKLCPPCCGIFSVYDEAEDRFILDAYCRTETFVGDIYKCLIDLAKSMKERPEFVDDWVWDSFNSDCSELIDDESLLQEVFINKIKSEKIRNYLREMDSYHKNRNHFRRIERKCQKSN